MGKLTKLASAFLLATALSTQSNAQSMRIRVIDPILKLIDTSQVGLENMFVILNDNFQGTSDTMLTDSQGYADIVTSVDDPKTNENVASALVYGDANKVRFEYPGDLEVRVFDILGRQIRTIEDGNWDLRNSQGTRISSAIYPFMLFSNDNLVGSGIINYYGRNVGVRQRQLQRTDRRQGEQVDKSGSLMTTSHYTLEIRDELTGEIGEFNDIVDNADNLEDFIGTSMNYNGTAERDVYEMLPNFEIDHPYDSNFYEFVMNNTGHAPNSNGHEISLTQLQESLPRTLFRNTSTAPTETFNQASLDLMNNIRDSSSIQHRGHVTPGIDITEVMQFDSSGYNLDYSEAYGATALNYLPIPPNSGLPAGAFDYAKCYINNTYGNGYLAIIRQLGHELIGHAFSAFGPEPSDGSEQFSTLSQNRKVLLNYLDAKQDYTNCSIIVPQ